MSESRSNLTVTLIYADESTRKYDLPDVEASAIATAKQVAKAINNGTAEHIDDFRRTFVSNSGASVTGIKSVSFVTITEEDIYNANS